MKILITAFEPFGEDEKNASQEAMNTLNEPENREVIKLIVPVVFGKAAEVVNSVIDREKPDAVICLGQAGGRDRISLERTAVNLCDSKNPDNEGKTPDMEPVIPDGREAYTSTLPIEQMFEYLSAAGIPAEISESAGTYVCNSLMYGMLHHLEETGRQIPAGFIHVPYYREQVEGKKERTPFMELPEIVKGVEICIRCI